MIVAVSLSLRVGASFEGQAARDEMVHESPEAFLHLRYERATLDPFPSWVDLEEPL